MPAPSYTREELLALASDEEFQRVVREDDDLNRLFHDYDPDELSDRTMHSLGSGLELCGIIIPPPTLGTVRLLKAIQSPFFADTDEAKVRFGRDPYGVISECLYVLTQGADAVAPYSSHFAMRAKLKHYLELAAAKGQSEWLDKLLIAQKKVEDELAKWDMDIAKWCEQNKVRMQVGEDVLSVSKQLSEWIAGAFSGFQLFPATGKSSLKADGWDDEHEASIISLVCETMPSAGLTEIRWKIPLQTIGYLCAKGAQKRGMKGIGRRPRGEQCMDRLHNLMDEASKRINHK